MQTTSVRAFVFYLLFSCFYVQLAFARVGLNDPEAHATIASDGTDTSPGHESRTIADMTIIVREGYGSDISNGTSNSTDDSGSSNSATGSAVIALGWQLPLGLAVVLGSSLL